MDRFLVYQNPAVLKALTAESVKPRWKDIARAMGSFTLAVLLIVASEGIVHWSLWQWILIKGNLLLEPLGLRLSLPDISARVLRGLATVLLVFSTSSLFSMLALIRNINKNLAEPTQAGGASLAEKQRKLLGLPIGTPSTSKLPSRPPPSPSPGPSLLAPLHPLATGSPAPGITGPSTSPHWASRSQASGGLIAALPTAGSFSGSQPYGTPDGTPWTTPSPGGPVGGASSGGRKKSRAVSTEENLEELLAALDQRLTETAPDEPSAFASLSATFSPPPQAPLQNLPPQSFSTPVQPLSRGYHTLGSPSPSPYAGSPGLGAGSPGLSLGLSPEGSRYGTPGSASRGAYRGGTPSPSGGKPGVPPTPPVKHDKEMPQPMSFEAFQGALKKMNVGLKEMEEGRDRLRQWFSRKVLQPLVQRLASSHSKVASAVSALGLPSQITLTPLVASFAESAPSLATRGRPTGPDASKVQETAALEEENLLVQLRNALETERQKAMKPATPSLLGAFGQQQQSGPSLAVIQECLGAVIEHQRLRTLLKGELLKGILPHSPTSFEYMANRIQELAQGTCVREYNWSGGGTFEGSAWETHEHLPSDTHLLIYLFCCFLEHPSWMLQLDPLTGPGHQGGSFYVGALPPRPPERFVAVLSTPLPPEPRGIRTALRQPGVSSLLVSRQTPEPPLYLVWDGKFQFVLKGRTALWDVIVLLSKRIRDAHGGMVKGVSLHSSNIELLPFFDP